MVPVSILRRPAARRLREYPCWGPRQERAAKKRGTKELPSSSWLYHRCIDCRPDPCVAHVVPHVVDHAGIGPIAETPMCVSVPIGLAVKVVELVWLPRPRI